MENKTGLNPYCNVLFLVQRFVTVSARRATVWDGKTGEAINTLTSKRLLGNEEVDITAFSLDHQVCCLIHRFVPRQGGHMSTFGAKYSRP